MAKVQELGQNLNPMRLPKKEIVETTKAEEIATKIHAIEEPSPVVEVEPVKKTSFDFPISLYRSVKVRVAERGISMRDYIITLIEKDLENK